VNWRHPRNHETATIEQTALGWTVFTSKPGTRMAPIPAFACTTREACEKELERLGFERSK